MLLAIPPKFSLLHSLFPRECRRPATVLSTWCDYTTYAEHVKLFSDHFLLPGVSLFIGRSRRACPACPAHPASPTSASAWHWHRTTAKPPAPGYAPRLRPHSFAPGICPRLHNGYSSRPRAGSRRSSRTGVCREAKKKKTEIPSVPPPEALGKSDPPIFRRCDFAKQTFLRFNVCPVPEAGVSGNRGRGSGGRGSGGPGDRGLCWRQFLTPALLRGTRHYGIIHAK